MRGHLWLYGLGWVMVAACAYVSGALVWEAAQLPFQAGGGAAQGDLGLFMAARLVGLPVAAVSLGAIAIAWAASRKHKGGMAAFSGYRTFIVISIVNIFVAPGVMAWLRWVYK